MSTSIHYKWTWPIRRKKKTLKLIWSGSESSKIHVKYIIMFYSNGEEWARNRKPTQRNMLRPITVARYFPMMSEISDEFVQKLQEKGTVTDIQSQLLAFAIERKWTSYNLYSYFIRSQRFITDLVILVLLWLSFSTFCSWSRVSVIE